MKSVHKFKLLLIISIVLQSSFKIISLPVLGQSLSWIDLKNAYDNDPNNKEIVEIILDFAKVETDPDSLEFIKQAFPQEILKVSKLNEFKKTISSRLNKFKSYIKDNQKTIATSTLIAAIAVLYKNEIVDKGKVLANTATEKFPNIIKFFNDKKEVISNKLDLTKKYMLLKSEEGLAISSKLIKENFLVKRINEFIKETMHEIKISCVIVEA